MIDMDTITEALQALTNENGVPLPGESIDSLADTIANELERQGYTVLS